MESELSLNRRMKIEKVKNLENYLNRLEEELRKVGAFKNELPLCMMLLTDAINLVKDELKSNSEPILEEFIPLKSSGDEIEEKKDNVVVNNNNNNNCKDKKDWMSSFQLWNDCDDDNNKVTLKLDDKKNCEEQGRRIGVHFKECGLSLAPPQIKKCGEEIDLVAESGANERLSPKVGGNARKQRRCWSFELHRRFINALHQLGGAQAATPKQIREHMQVDGLTNDEVKSHLQKYRLHNRRVSSTTNSSSIQPTTTSKQSNSKSDSPHGPLHLPGSSSRCTSLTGGDGLEDEDDVKSESHTNLPKSDHS